MDILPFPASDDPTEPVWKKLLSNKPDQTLASDIWTATIAEMRATGTLAKVNATQNKRYVIACVFYDRAIREVDRIGPVLEPQGAAMHRINPQFLVAKECDAIASRHEAELGLNPRRRGMVQAAKKTKTKTAADGYLTTG
jgi:Phage terminase, small subunit